MSHDHIRNNLRVACALIRLGDRAFSPPRVYCGFGAVACTKFYDTTSVPVPLSLVWVTLHIRGRWRGGRDHQNRIAINRCLLGYKELLEMAWAEVNVVNLRIFPWYVCFICLRKWHKSENRKLLKYAKGEGKTCSKKERSLWRLCISTGRSSTPPQQSVNWMAD